MTLHHSYFLDKPASGGLLWTLRRQVLRIDDGELVIEHTGMESGLHLRLAAALTTAVIEKERETGAMLDFRDVWAIAAQLRAQEPA